MATRLTLIVTLMLLLIGAVESACAQETTTAAATDTTDTTETTTAAAETTTTAETSTAAAKARPAATTTADTASYETRNRFARLLRDHYPPELAMILKLDPNLLSNETFLSGYPDLARFLRENPEVRMHPRFYLAAFPTPGADDTVLDMFMEVLAVFAGFGLALFALGWLIRTVIEQKRWNRLSRAQNEVHNKILDRFGSSEEVLEYIKSPAGTKFLESAPIPVRVESPVKHAPATRIMWSVQLGVILATAGLGMLLVSLRFSGETGQGLFALGAIGFCIGAGFIASAAASIFLSRRLGIWKLPEGDQ